MRRGITTMKNVISVMMRKGGAGKTTKTLLLADALARFGLNVLVIDMDPQGNASLGLGRPVMMVAVEARIGKSKLEEPDVLTVIEVINSGEDGVADEAIIIIDTPGWTYDVDAPFHRGGPLRPGKVGTIGLIPAYEALEDLPSSWKPADFERLAHSLLLPAEPGGTPPNHRWDVVLIDTAIAQRLGVQAAKAAYYALFVTNAQKFGVDAIPKTMRLIKDVRENYYHDDIEVMGLVWNAFTPRQTTARALANDAAEANESEIEHWEAPIWPYEIPSYTVVSDSHDMAAPVSAFLSTSEKRETARKVTQVAEATALRLLDKIEHPLAGELRAAWHEAWPKAEQTDVMTKGVA
ncbi:ParA family protein [Nonomuraea dietziae]|uniref:ParA family protein n=1 Tax=Nonomuraea dietziae TaxID=65515 RepID=UPI003F4D2B2B